VNSLGPFFIGVYHELLSYLCHHCPLLLRYYITRDGVWVMKKLFVLLAVLMTVSIFPLTAYADEDNHHDQQWKEHHDRTWRDHERDWKDHDREWKEHRHDQHWREVHAREWHDWYQWHRDSDSEFHLHVSGDGFELDIDR